MYTFSGFTVRPFFSNFGTILNFQLNNDTRSNNTTKKNNNINNHIASHLHDLCFYFIQINKFFCFTIYFGILKFSFRPTQSPQSFTKKNRKRCWVIILQLFSLPYKYCALINYPLLFFFLGVIHSFAFLFSYNFSLSLPLFSFSVALSVSH